MIVRIENKAHGKGYAYNLKLNRQETKVDQLHSRPQHPVRFQGWQVDILKLLHNCLLASAFGKAHKGEERAQTFSY